jgi:ATP-binding protein involved in chromosome partitioning
MKTYDDLAGDGGSNVIEQVVSQREKLRKRLDTIKHKISIMSGKGGVGKSSVTANMAICLASMGHKVGILDADLNGPSMGKLLSVQHSDKLNISPEGVQPAVGALGIKIMSMDMLLPNADSPVMWNEGKEATAVWISMMESQALRELLTDTIWGELDYRDRIDNVRDLIPELDGVVEITIPSQISQHIVSKSISKSNQLGVSIIGLVENMATYVCPHCNEEGKLFEGEDVEKLSKDKKIPLLGSIPFDTRVSRQTGAGKTFFEEHADSVTGQAIKQVVDNILKFIQNKSN